MYVCISLCVCVSVCCVCVCVCVCVDINSCFVVFLSCKYEWFKNVTDTCVHVRLFMCDCIYM